MVTLARRAQHIPFAPAVAGLFGVVAAILVAAVPQWLFESAVFASGLPSLLQAAAPPLGLLARCLAIAGAFAAVTCLLWLVLAPLTQVFEARARARTPWRDVGYDMDTNLFGIAPLPARRPIFAPDELGAPLMSDAAIAPSVSDVDVTLDLPTEVSPVLAAVPLGSVVTAATTPDNSIRMLIGRLEDGLARRAGNDVDPDGSGRGAMPPSWHGTAGQSTSAPVEDDGDAIRQALGAFKRMARG